MIVLITLAFCAAATLLLKRLNERPPAVGKPAWAVIGIVSIAAAWWIRWPTYLCEPLALWLIPCVCVWTLTWRYTTRGFTPGGVGPDAAQRWLLLLLSAVAVWSPAILPLWLGLVARYRWTLHELVPRQLVAATVCFVMASGLVGRFALQNDAVSAAAYWVVCVACVASHYVFPGVTKLASGPGVLSWIRHVRLDLIPLAAMLWGWPPDADERRIRGMCRAIRRLNPMIATATVAFELAPLWALTHPVVLSIAMLGCVVFHAGYFLMSGALFWELMTVNLLLAVLAMLGPPDMAYSVEANAIFLAAVVASRIVWRVPRLTWWECRLVQRVFWEVEDRSGNTYALTHTWMRTREADFYKGLPALLPYARATENLCHTFLPLKTVETLLADEPDEAAIRLAAPPQQIRPEAVAKHANFLRRFFTNVNAGYVPGPLPARWRLLEAPGAYFASGSRAPVYHGQRPVVHVAVKYGEWYVTDTSIVCLREETILACPIDPPETDLVQTCGNSFSISNGDQLR